LGYGFLSGIVDWLLQKLAFVVSRWDGSVRVGVEVLVLGELEESEESEELGGVYIIYLYYINRNACPAVVIDAGFNIWVVFSCVVGVLMPLSCPLGVWH
jgi:hypothetical protein